MVDRMRRTLSSWVFSITLLLATGTALPEQQYVFPAKGQSPEQQKRDEYECHSWAMQQTGYDPTTAAMPAPAMMSHSVAPDYRHPQGDD